ncbi:AraC family transcriptional regulator [Aquibacillus rhizosphaerae]|uniref:AraC family transcriptional regulator n=1 Tax=Aquibacillus rhizosphaerae TaxID=3051431 RepID=A0ABT7LAY6_9BACI|nr:AraC family transcriptional regulator [Aquibacillus sp. LR5S19]MDL4843027.1 AraC family transcriptional regulator [Aquibacillus sp. LR5S19]
MNQVSINAYNLPLVREVGFMSDKEGIMRHPERNMDKINVFVYVKQGSIHVIESGIEYHIKQGTYLFLRKGIPHWGEKHYTPGTEWYYIHFYDAPQQESNSEYSSFQQASMILEDTYDKQLTLPKVGKVFQPEYVEILLAKLLDRYDTPSPIRPLSLSVMTYELFVDLYRNKHDENKDKKTHRIVGKVIELCRNSSKNKLSGQDISKAIGMNYAYLSSLFREQTGKTITQFQNELLIEKAIRLFKEDTLNVSEVSSYLGFSNPFYFSRVFKKVTGISPSTYLNQNYRNY